MRIADLANDNHLFCAHHLRNRLGTRQLDLMHLHSAVARDFITVGLLKESIGNKCTRRNLRHAGPGDLVRRPQSGEEQLCRGQLHRLILPIRIFTL